MTKSNPNTQRICHICDWNYTDAVGHAEQQCRNNITAFQAYVREQENNLTRRQLAFMEQWGSPP